jgi:1-acyl-sn-glycerol-3-phosphate acyltransferase/ElaB/YqjD/DUF883 family membrane-anchored ribosome-binding protein
MSERPPQTSKRKRPSARRSSAPPPERANTEAESTAAASSRPKARAARRSPTPAPAGAEAQQAETRQTRSTGRSSKKRAARASAQPVEPEAVPEPPAAAAEAGETEASVDRELQDIDARIERLLRDSDELAGDPEARRRAAEALSKIARRLGASGGDDDWPREVQGPARDVLSSDYFARQWSRFAMRDRSGHVDDFGLDPVYEARYAPLFEALYRRYFRVQTEGIDRVPHTGRALLVANHGGTFPWDGIMLKMALRLEHPTRHELRWLAEDRFFHMPFVGSFMNRLGAVRACPENAERLLDLDKLVGVFPEGGQGTGKTFRQRYQLQRFGRGGYVKLALRTGTPLVPVAVVGSEETNPLLFKLGSVSKAMGLPYIPVTPTFPWFGPVGLAPLPARWRIVFGEPIDLSEYGPEAAEDALVVNRLNERVRSTVQSMLDEALAARRSPFYG